MADTEPAVPETTSAASPDQVPEQQPALKQVSETERAPSSPAEDEGNEAKAAKSKLFKLLGPVYLTVFIDIISIALMIPVLPFYVLDIASEANGLTDEGKAQTVSDVTNINAWFSLAQMLSQLLCWGQLSDRWGRRPTIILSIVGSGLGFVATGLSTTVLTITLARVFAGLFAGSVPVAQAFVIDATQGLPQEDRNKYLGLIGATIGIAFTFGPGIGAVLVAILQAASVAQRLSFQVVLYLAGGFSFAASIYAFRNLQEPPNRVELPGAAPNTSSAVKVGEEGAAEPDGTSRQPEQQKVQQTGGILGALGANGRVLVVCFCSFCVMYAFNVMQVSYAIMMSDRFGWGSVELGGILVGCGIVGAFIQGKYIKPLSKALGTLNTAIMACIILSVGIVIYSMTGAAGGPGFIVIHMIGFLIHSAGFFISTPMLPALNSYYADEGKAGRALALSQSGQALARIISPFVTGAVYYDYWGPESPTSGAFPYLIGAGLALVAGLTLFLLGRAYPMVDLSAAPVVDAVDNADSADNGEAATTSI